MKKFLSFITVVIFFFIMAMQANAEWPDRPITLVITSAAGGGTDMIHRAEAAGMEKILGTSINVVYRLGATGAFGADFVHPKPPDGYWWLGTSQFGRPLRVMGYNKLSPWKDWQYYRSAGGIFSYNVREDSPFKTFTDLLAALRKNPEKYRIAFGGIGNVSHEGVTLTERTAKVKFNQVPFKSDTPGNLALLQGEVEIAFTTIGSAVEFYRGKKMRSLALFHDKPVTLKDGTVLRPVTDFIQDLSKYTPFGTGYTLALRRDTPVEILEKIKDAYIATVNSPEFEAVLDRKFFFKQLAVGEACDKWAARDECQTAWMLWDLQVQGVKVNPADLGIPRPEEFDAWWPPKGYKPRISGM